MMIYEITACFASSNELISLKHKVSQNFSADIEIHFFENAYSPGWFWLTIQDRKATKANACLTIAQQMKIDQKNLVVFGDNSNDTLRLTASRSSFKKEPAIKFPALLTNNPISNNSVASALPGLDD